MPNPIHARGSTLRLPTGALVAIAPTASGKTSVLSEKLRAGGLVERAVTSPAVLRTLFAKDCPDIAHKVVPATCRHFEEKVTALVDAAANTTLAAGESWFYEPAELDVNDLRAQVDRAHAAGLAAVALRRVAADGADVPVEFALANNAARDNRVPDAKVVASHAQYTTLTAQVLFDLGFDVVADWHEGTVVELIPSGPDARHITAPVTVVGDIHGCWETFKNLLRELGTDEHLSNPEVFLVSVGDIHDKGQHSVEVIRWWLWALKTGRAMMVDSNHNRKMVKVLLDPGKEPGVGLAATLAQIEAQPDAARLKADIVNTFGRLPSHLVFPGVVVAHAAMTEERLFRTDNKTRTFAMYTRAAKTPWEWTGSQTLVHGHVVVPTPSRRRAPVDPDRPDHVPGEVIDIDTGCCEGGGLTAYLSATDTTVTVPVVASDAMTAEQLAAHREILIARGFLTAGEVAELVARTA